MKTKSLIVDSPELAETVAYKLVQASMWYQCDPKPNHQYEFTVKEGDVARLKKIIDEGCEGISFVMG